MHICHINKKFTTTTTTVFWLGDCLSCTSLCTSDMIPYLPSHISIHPWAEIYHLSKGMHVTDVF